MVQIRNGNVFVPLVATTEEPFMMSIGKLVQVYLLASKYDSARSIDTESASFTVVLSAPARVADASRAGMRYWERDCSVGHLWRNSKVRRS